jgi:signal peptidase I
VIIERVACEGEGMLLTLGLILAVAMIGWLVIEAARRQQIWLAWVEVVVFGGLIGVTSVFHVARVEGGAMAPALADRDRVIVNKWIYQTAAPRVGDIVMFHYPLNPDKTFVMRVIAEEGDQIQIVKGRVYRNQVPLDDGYVAAEFRSHEDWGPEVIPPGYYFVIGDRRNNSSDSRHWGMVPKKYIVGKVQLRWWPPSTLRVF